MRRCAGLGLVTVGCRVDGLLMLRTDGLSLGAGRGKMKFGRRGAGGMADQEREGDNDDAVCALFVSEASGPQQSVVRRQCAGNCRG